MCSGEISVEVGSMSFLQTRAQTKIRQLNVTLKMIKQDKLLFDQGIVGRLWSSQQCLAKRLAKTLSQDT